ncbi:hypothetical protein BSKO_09602 [Bryopsis sp. KO-2023]|nr:hypothetical protein BSKO_09602 [Bryopsis sp. KO-2023]
MNLSDVVCDAVYVDHTEVKLPSSNRGERFYLKFYLIDKLGREVLAVTADDQGDAHYRYKNAKGFNHYGRLDSNSRKDVIMWLEKIIRLSQQRRGAGQSEGSSRLKIETEDHPEGVYLVRDSQEHVVLPDARRSTRWFLTDQYGDSHLAVIGMENQARDGHYVYTAQEPFASQLPLECRNKAGVYHWLESWIAHGSDEGGSQSTRGPNRLSRGKRPRPVVLDLEHNDIDRMTGSPKRQRLSEIEPEDDCHEGSFEPLWVREGREHAMQEAYRRRTIAVRALAWMKSEPSDDEIKIVEYWHDILKELVNRWEKSEAKMDVDEQAERGNEQQQQEDVEEEEEDDPHWLRLCVEALKEIGTMYMPLKLMSKTGVLRTIVRLKSHPDKCIARYSSSVARDWEHMMLSHTETLLDPIYIRDPVKEFEAKLSNGTPSTPPASAPKKPIDQFEAKSESAVEKMEMSGVEDGDREVEGGNPDIVVADSSKGPSISTEGSEGIINTTIKVEENGLARVEFQFKKKRRATDEEERNVVNSTSNPIKQEGVDEATGVEQVPVSDREADPDRISEIQSMGASETTPKLDDAEVPEEKPEQTPETPETETKDPVLGSPEETLSEQPPVLEAKAGSDGDNALDSSAEKNGVEATNKRPPSIIGGKELPSILHGRRASKELPGSKSELDSGAESDMSLNLEEIPDEFFEGADGSGNQVTPATDNAED